MQKICMSDENSQTYFYNSMLTNTLEHEQYYQF
jgi:hypothetical protein